MWRPQDGERIQLLSLEEEEVFPSRCKCLLTDDYKLGDAPLSGNCFVVVFDLDTDAMWVCRIGADRWDTFRYEGPRHVYRGHGIAAVGGKIYYELSGYELGTITFGHEDCLPGLDARIDVDMVDLPRSKPMGSTYLVESRRDLFLLVVFFDGYNVHVVAELTVYRMDFSAESAAWCKVDCIRADKVFLLGGDMIGISNFGVSCLADGGLRGNCVYFLNHLSIIENFVHVFDLKNGGEQVQRPFMHKGFSTLPRPPFWLLPTSTE